MSTIAATLRGEGLLERYFRFAERGTTIGRDTTAGLTTFVVMSYIIFVNPSILSGATPKFGPALAFSAVLTSTCLVAGVMSILMGLSTNYAYAIAPGMGLNAVVAYGLVASGKASFPEAMGLVVLEGVTMVVLAVTGLREMIFRAIPLELKKAIAIGIGLFIAFIGLYNSGIIASLPPSAGQPVTLGNFTTWPIFVAIFGILLHVRAAGDPLPRRPDRGDHRHDGRRDGHQLARLEPPRVRHVDGDLAGLEPPLRGAELPPARADQPPLLLEHAARRHRLCRLGLLALPQRLLRLLGDGDRRRQGGRLRRRRPATSRSSRRR